MLTPVERFTVQAAIAAMAGTALAVGIIALVFATGNTFGQRCARIFPDKQAAWSQCVSDLAAGRAVSSDPEQSR